MCMCRGSCPCHNVSCARSAAVLRRGSAVSLLGSLHLRQRPRLLLVAWLRFIGRSVATPLTSSLGLAYASGQL